MTDKNGWKSILSVIKWALIFLALYNCYWMLLGKLILATEQEVDMQFLMGLMIGASIGAFLMGVIIGGSDE